MKQIGCVLVLATAASFAHSSFALDAAYWLPASSAWGLYGTAENWAIGLAESETHVVPGTGHSIVLNKNMKFDLDGASQAVGGLTGTGSGGNASYLMSFTNGTFSVDGSLASCVRFEVWDGATAVVKSKSARYWGCYCGSDTVIVHAGGRYEERGKLQFQGYRVMVEKGGTVVHAPTSYGPHPGMGSAQNCHVYGRYEAPNGLKRWNEWDTTYEKPGGSVTYFVHDGGTLLLGGAVSRNTQVQIPFNLKFEDGCTLIASNTVTFAANMDLVKVMEDAAVTMEVVKDATLDLANVTVGEGATVTKTGPGKVILGTTTIPTLTVNAGSVEINDGAALPTECSFAAGSKLILNCPGVKLNPTAYDGLLIELNSALLIPGATLLQSDIPGFLTHAQGAVASQMPAGYGAVIHGDRLVYAKSSVYMFDPTKTSDLSDPSGWNGEIPTATDDVLISGTGTAAFTSTTTKFKSITLQLGATLAVSGGTEADPVDIPPVQLDYDARLLVSDHAILTNVFTTIGDADTLPILEIATNAVVTAQTPGPLPLKNVFDHWSYHYDDYGFRLKNVKLRWYGTIKSPIQDLKTAGKHASLYLGYAAANETSYIAIDCQGGTWQPPAEGLSADRARTPFIIATPDNGGTVIPVGTLRFRDFRRDTQPATAGTSSPEYHWSGLYIGKANPWYTGNPASVEYEVVFEGARTWLNNQGFNRIAGGAHVTFRDGASWVYGNLAYNENDFPRSVLLYEKATLKAESGARLEFWPSSSQTGSGIRFTSAQHAAGSEAFTACDATLSLLSWGGSSSGIAVIDNAKLLLGNDRDHLGTNPVYNTGVFANLTAARLDGDLTVSATNSWMCRNGERNFEWTREVTIGAPLTGVGGLVVTNEMPAAKAQYGMTVTVTNGQNTATGVAQACETVTGPARLVFADGANWAGTVVGSGRVSLTNLVDGTAPATVNFGSVTGTMPIRVWKTGNVITTNDVVNLNGTATAFEFIPMGGAKLLQDDVVVIGLYPESAALPENTRHVKYGSVASETPGYVLLKAKSVCPGLVLLIR